MNRAETSVYTSIVSQRKPAARVTKRTGKRSHANAGRRTKSSLRTRVLAAFRDMANASSPKAALERTKEFYRSSGADWARHLS